MRIKNVTIFLNKIISLIQIAVGGISLLFWGIGGIGAFLDKEMEWGFIELLIVLAFCAFAGWLLYCGIKRSRLGKKLKNYGNVIGDVAYISINEIAESIRESESQVVNDFKWFIKKNFLVDAYIDYEEHALVFREAYSKVIEKREQEEQAKKQIVYVSAVCKCCNGVTEIQKGKVGKCEYCGAPIEE